MDTTYQNIDGLCRTCMNELSEASSGDGDKKPQGWLSIFDIIEEECDAFRIDELLSQAVPHIQVQLSDDLPKTICCSCLQQLLSVHGFQQMCLQSEQKMRQQISKKQIDLSIPADSKEGEIASNDAGSENIAKPEAAEKDELLMEDCTDSQNNFSQFVKNEPIEDDELEMDDSDGDTIQSIISVKGEVLAIESEEPQINKTLSHHTSNTVLQNLRSRSHIKTHRVVHGEDKPYECPYCPLRFNSKANVDEHKAIHEGIKREDCDICGKSIRKSNLKQHKRIHTGEKDHKCDFCEKRFVHMSHLRCHIRKHTGEKPYKCKYCERSFAQNCHRWYHMIAHLGPNVHRCELCPLAFPKASKLREHLTAHKNEDPETRERNMKALKEAEAELQQKLSKRSPQHHSKENAKTHRIIQAEYKTYDCPYCPLKVTGKQNLYQHKAIHEGDKRETCDICGKSVLKSKLKQHKLIHSEVKPHKCDFCEKRFVKMSDLRVHNRQHTGEKPYKCKYCERSFTYRNLHMQHMRLHLGDNVYRCELCPLAFSLAAELREHLTTHKNEDSETRERNIKALKEAEAEQNARLHMRLHVGVNVHTCRLCPLAFPSATELRAHFITHKNEDPETRDRNMKALKEEEDKLQLKLGKKSREESLNQ